MPAISVILPVYNTEQYIKEAVESILNQSFTDFELLIINDASTDNTLQILKQFTDTRIKIINNETNVKVVRSLNKGLALATGEFVARMDADDIAHWLRFEKQFQFLKAHSQIDVCGSWAQLFGKENVMLRLPESHESIKANLCFLNPIIHPSIMFRRASFEKYHLQYEEKYTNAEDYGLWVKVIDLLQFANLPEVLLFYRVHEWNVSIPKNNNEQLLDDIHYQEYKRFFTKLQLQYTQKELELHRKLALKKTGLLQTSELNRYLHWLKKLNKANDETQYFDIKAFKSVLISYALFLVKQTVSSVTNYRMLLQALFSLGILNTFTFLYTTIKNKRKPVEA